MDLNIDLAWLRRMGEQDDGGPISVGGLITRLKQAETVYCCHCDRWWPVADAPDPADWRTVDDGGVAVTVCPACAAGWADAPRVTPAP